MIRKNRILSNSAKFSAGRPTLPAYNFLATMASTYSTYRLGAVASLKFLAIENMTPHFSAHVYGKTAGWIKIPPGTEVGLGPGDIMLDGDPAPAPKKGEAAPQDGTWYGDRLLPRPHCVRWGPSSPTPKKAQPPIFGPCLLWPNGWMDQMPLGIRRYTSAQAILCTTNPTIFIAITTNFPNFVL